MEFSEIKNKTNSVSNLINIFETKKNPNVIKTKVETKKKDNENNKKEDIKIINENFQSNEKNQNKQKIKDDIFYFNNENIKDEVDTYHANQIPESAFKTLFNAIVRIEIHKFTGTGFFIKMKIKNNFLKCLLTNSHTITSEDINSKEEFNIYFGELKKEKKLLIKLDKRERFIKCFEKPVDITLIEILEGDNIPDKKYLMPDLNYQNGFNIYDGERFYLAGYPHDIQFEKQRFISSGTIIKIKDFQFAHTLDTRSGSSGSPICLINKLHNVVGIHKSGNKIDKINYGTFIGHVIDILGKDNDININDLKKQANIINTTQKKTNIIKLNPFSVLNVDDNFKVDQFILDKKFHEKVKNKREFLCFFMIYNEERFKRIKNEFFIEKKDHFFYTIINDLQGLKEEYGKNRYILAEKDNIGNTLLHLSVLGGYYEISEYLLKKLINFNEPNIYCKTALYYATIYNKNKIKELLKKYGAENEEYQIIVLPKGIKITFNAIDKISLIYRQLYEKGFIEKDIKNIKMNEMIVGKRLIRKNIDNRNPIKVYHGTLFVSIESIMNSGLIYIDIPLVGHIPKGDKLNNIIDWASAIFVSPSIFYASKYSEVIESENQEWYIIIEGKVEIGSFTEHPSTIHNYISKDDEPKNLEYRIDINSVTKFSIKTTSLLFVNKQYLQRMKKFKESDIFIKLE